MPQLGDSAERVHEELLQVCFGFGEDQAKLSSGQRFLPPTQLARHLAVWRWDKSQVHDWLHEALDFIPGFSPPELDGPELLLKRGKVGGPHEALVEEALVGQLTGFFDVMAEECVEVTAQAGE